MHRYPTALLTTLLLILASLAVYWQVQKNGFVNFDDNLYVTENRHVQAGLSPESVRWAFRLEAETAYWHPMTWLSLMLDHDLYGLNPQGYHFTSLLLHILNTVLLFAALKKMTGAHWQSAFVAALFAVHPLNVESVAWVAERKNVLSTFFWMLTMWAYACYARRATLSRYFLVLLPFVLGLMAKPMLVTLPFVLLLLDYWPLGRLQLGQYSKEPGATARQSVNPHSQAQPVFRLILEKVPLLLIAAASIFLSSFSVQSPGLTISMESVPMTLRIANALVSYVSYIAKMIWPHNLAVFYPPPNIAPTWQAVSAALLLVLVSIVVLRAAATRPYLAVGWLWYIGTLVPVTGLVRVGLWPAMADRFAYVPLIGLFIMIVWALRDLATRWPNKKIVLAISAATLISALMIRASLQVRHWKKSVSLWTHTLGVTANNDVAHTNMGIVLQHEGHLDEAMSHYSEALRINPGYAQTHNNLGAAFASQGRLDKAINHYSEALRIEPDNVKAHNNLGLALARLGRLKEAVGHFSEAVRINPDYAEAHDNLGVALARLGRLKEAVSHHSEALRINPHCPKAHYNLGVALARQGRLDEAISQYFEALRIKPDYAQAHNSLGLALAQQGNLKDAISRFSRALEIKPDYEEARSNLEVCLTNAGKTPGASNTASRP